MKRTAERREAKCIVTIRFGIDKLERRDVGKVKKALQSRS
jgi:hypothetical protein